MEVKYSVEAIRSGGSAIGFRLGIDHLDGCICGDV
jgi:hypothetical protein